MKQALTGAAFTAIIALGIIIWLLRSHASTVNQYESLLDADRNIISYHMNRAGKAVAQASQATVTLELYKKTHPEDLRKTLADLDIKQKELRYFIKTSFDASNKGESVVHHHHYYDTLGGDSVEESSFDINDNYLSLHGDTKTAPGSPWLKVNWDYQYVDTLTVAGVVKKKGLFGKQRYFVDAVLSNPKARATGVKGVEIKEFKDKRFGIGPAITWDPFTGTFHPGISVHYDLIRF